MLHVGIDLGGTKIEGVVLDRDHCVLRRERIATEADRGYAHILDRVALLYARLFRSTETPGAPHTLGIGTPGAPSPRTGLMRNSNTLVLNGRSLGPDLERRLGHTLTLANDANCFALAEARMGAGRGHRLVFGVIVGTGCGGGIVMDGHMHVGRQSIGGEWGHMSIDPLGPDCYCGQRGCVETYISGSGLEARFLERFGATHGAEQIFALANAGDTRCTAAVSEFYLRFGRALANLIDVLDPDVIVVGGGLSNVDDLYTRGRDAVAACVFTDAFDTPIVRNALGDAAGVFGAALLGASH